jgi:hypothetical protein
VVRKPVHPVHHNSFAEEHHRLLCCAWLHVPQGPLLMFHCKT